MEEHPPNEQFPGWLDVKKAITKLQRIVEGADEKFDAEEYMMVHTTVYNMCTADPPYSNMLYSYYTQVLDEYVRYTVLPSITEKQDELMLRELVRRWNNYKTMVKCFSRFFGYLERFFILVRRKPSLEKAARTCFFDLVHEEIKVKAINTVIALMNKEREGEEVDIALLKNVIDIFLESGQWEFDCYENDFEDSMLEATEVYYIQKVSNWTQGSWAEYMRKAEICLKTERERVSQYMNPNSVEKVIEKLHNLLLDFSTQLPHEDSGYRESLKGIVSPKAIYVKREKVRRRV
ncbi:CUL1 [Linum perenne]